ncbi:hypothetical protein IKE67_04440 [bacterium]|nr:hypothetical protein [bacterium]
MGKTSSQTTYVAPLADGSYSINGVTKATTKRSGGTIKGNYNMNKYERALYDYAQKTLAEIVPNINTFSDNTMNNIQAQLNAYQNQGEQNINSMYAPLLYNLKNDIASRFGNLDNSMFLDNLNKIEYSRGNAIAQLAENILAKRNELINDELSNRYNLINLLSSIQGQSNSTAMSAITAALNLANSLKATNSVNSSPSSGFNLQSMLSLMNAFL